MHRLDSDLTFKVLKTWLNSWATSARYQNNENVVYPCLICGLRKGDALEHYLSCEAAWNCILAVTGDLPAPTLYNRLALYTQYS